MKKKKRVIKKREVAIKNLSMADTFVDSKQLAFMLGRTPEQHIYSRPAKGGGTWSYVTGIYVQKILNYVFGWNWDFQIVDKGREGNLVWVQGRLTIRDKDGNIRIIKEQFGRADIKMKRGSNEALDYGNDLKAASTDALKKCASQLGIASDVYGKNEFKDVGVKVVTADMVSPIPNKKKMEAINKLSKCTSQKSLISAWHKLPKELKADKEIIAEAGNIKSFIIDAKKNENI